MAQSKDHLIPGVHKNLPACPPYSKIKKKKNHKKERSKKATCKKEKQPNRSISFGYFDKSLEQYIDVKSYRALLDCTGFCATLY
jgi:hypothetical protein